MRTAPARPSLRARQLLDLAVYVVALTALTTLVAVGVMVAAGAGMALVVHLTFVLGFLMFGYATYLLWPKRLWRKKETEEGEIRVTKTQTGEVVGAREETKFQSMVQRLPPLTTYSLAPSERLSPGVKLFVASLVVLATSFAVEMVFVS